MGIIVSGLETLLQVFDMPTSLAFYRDVIGFEVVQSAPPGDDCDWCRLRLGDVELMLNTQFEKLERPSTADHQRIANHGDTCLYFECPAIDAAYAHLKVSGIAVDPPVTREYGTRQLCVVDPDGYSLYFQWPAN